MSTSKHTDTANTVWKPALFDRVTPTIRDGEFGGTIRFDNETELWLHARSWDGIRHLIELQRLGEFDHSNAIEHLLAELADDALAIGSPWHLLIDAVTEEMGQHRELGRLP